MPKQGGQGKGKPKLKDKNFGKALIRQRLRDDTQGYGCNCFIIILQTLTIGLQSCSQRNNANDEYTRQLGVGNSSFYRCFLV